MPESNPITESPLVSSEDVVQRDRLIKGVYDVEEFADAVDALREKGLPRGLTAGYEAFDRLYSVPRKQWTVVTGYSGSGKSTFLDNINVRLAGLHGWKTLYCSPENQPIEEHIAALMEIFSGKKFGRPEATESPRVYMTDHEYAHAFAFVAKHFQFINPPDVSFNIKDIVDLAREVKETQFDFDGFVIDPYNELEHKRPSAMSETEYISWVISVFRRFVQAYDLHGWFVAHPTKPQQVQIKYSQGATEEELTRKVYKRCTLFDISGSAHWKSKCDFGLIVHRDMQDSTAPSVIEIEKVRKRYQGKKGEVPMFYDFYNNRYHEKYDDLLAMKTY